MKRNTNGLSKIKAGFMCASMGTVMQFGACNIGDIPAATTIDGREALIALIRGALLSPIDAYITQTVNNLFDED